MCARNYGTPAGYVLLDGAGYGTVVPIDTIEPVIDATPYEVVDSMLGAVRVGPGDLVYDPGCGDGRIVLAAARLGAQAVGIEIRPQVAELAKQNVRQAAVGRIRIVEGDARKMDLRAATVVAMYMGVDVIRDLMPRISPDARVVSYLHKIPGRNNREILVAGRYRIYVAEPETVSLTAFPM